jgi:hypothetical protein
MPLIAAASGIEAGVLVAFAVTNFTNTITLGSVIVGALVAIATVAAVIWGARFKVSYQAASAAAEELRKSLNDANERGNRLEKALQEALTTIGEQKETIERLAALPNLERVIQLMSDTAERADAHAARRLEHGITRIEQLFDAHEERALDRHDKTVAVLAGMAANLERLNERQAA